MTNCYVIYKKDTKEIVGIIKTDDPKQVIHKDYDYDLIASNESSVQDIEEINTDTLNVRVKFFDKELYAGENTLQRIGEKSDWIDLRAREDIYLKKGKTYYIPLGVAIELPQGYEAHIVPRSSTFKKWGIIQTNSMGIIDESYCGDNDEWCMPVIAVRPTYIHRGDRVCQFRIAEHQPEVSFEVVDVLGNPDRNGFGSTGTK